MEDPAARFYQRSFERSVTAGEGENYRDEASIKRGTHRYSAAFAHLKDNQHQIVLEMGYGGYGIIKMLAPLAREYHIVDVVDRTGTLGLPSNVCQYQANLDNPFPFADAQFDTLIAMTVIEHLYDPFHAFGEVARVTRPGGDLFVNLPNIAALRCRLQLLMGRMPITSTPQWFDMREWDGSHLHYFTVSDVRRIGALYGLELVNLCPVGRTTAHKALRPALFCHEITYHFRKAMGGGLPWVKPRSCSIGERAWRSFF